LGLEPIKLDIRNAQFLGDVICMTPVPRDMAAVRRCTECLFEAALPAKSLEPPLECPNCGRQTLARKFMVRARTYDIEKGVKKGKPHFMPIFDSNPYIDDFEGDPDMVLRLGTRLGCKGSNSSGEHITQAFRKAVMAKTGFQFPQGLLKPDLHLSEHEKNMPRMVDGRYWVICIGKRPPFTSKFWPPERWQAVVDYLSDITFVQIGHSDHQQPELIGDNVINMVGQTQDKEKGLRDLFRLVYHADGCCSLVSSLMHIAAAFDKPCVIPAGAREPVRFEQYAFHRYLHVQGSMDCEGITPGDAVDSIQITDTQILDAGILHASVSKTLKEQPNPLGNNVMVTAIEDRGNAWLIESDGADFYIDDHEGSLKLYEAKHRKHGGIKSCWKASADACPNLEDGYPKCQLMIGIDDVIRAIESYYVGGFLEPVAAEKAKVNTSRQKTCKIVCNAHGWGGGERSSVYLANRMLEEHYDIYLHPTGNVNDNYKKELSQYVKVADPNHPLTEECDLMILYTNDIVMKFENDPKIGILENVNAKRKVMVLNYRLGAAGKVGWTKEWDKYIFLCSEMEEKFKTLVPGCSSVVLPPPVDLKPFLDSNFGSLNRTLHIVRVGSQSSQKFPENIRQIVEQIKAVHPAASFTFMGGHPMLNDLDYVTQYDEYSKPVLDILRKGTVFWYILPDNYLDNGPRVILEAMAAGLPVVADNRGGAANRVTPETGWLCNTQEEHIEVFRQITGVELAKKGKAARERALTQFDPERWITEIVNG